MSNVLSVEVEESTESLPRFTLHRNDEDNSGRSIAATLHGSQNGLVRGASIAELTSDSAALLLFLPDLTTPEGKQAASELSRTLSSRTEQSILVHRHDDSVAEPILVSHGLGNLRRLPDPSLRVHRAFGIDPLIDPEPIPLLSVLAPLSGAIWLQQERIVRLSNN